MTIYVFVGPSLSSAEAARYLDAVYLPPIAMGDLVRLLALKPRAIGIIDGVFETVPSVWHKEILFALSQGVPVYGAASMGALRAAELHAFGMRGIGQIFEQYRDRALEDDDEVAVAHETAEGDYRALSEPMVNIRSALSAAAAESVISEGTALTLLVHAKALFYPDRSWPELLRAGKDLGISETELAALRARFPKPPNLKRDDAVAMLQAMKRDMEAGLPEPSPNFDFEPTYYWNTLVAFESASHTPSPAPADELPVGVSALGRHVRLTHPEREQLLRDALFGFLVYHEAKRCGFVPDGFEAEATAALSGSARALPVAPEALGDLIERLGDELVASLRSRLDLFIAAELAVRDELPNRVAEVRQKQLVARSKGLSEPRLSTAGLDLEGLSAWYDARFGRPKTSGDEHARDLGFGSWEEFISEALVEYLSDAARNAPARAPHDA